MSPGLIKIGILLTFLILLCFSALYDLKHWKQQQGERLLVAGDPRGALAVWSGATLLNGDSSGRAFNQGIARYRLGELDKAASEFQAALATSDMKLRQSALYNLGTTQLQLAKVKQERDRLMAARHTAEAIRWLREARTLDPDDADVQQNEAIARILLATLDASVKMPREKAKNPDGKHEVSKQAAGAGNGKKSEKVAGKQQGDGKPGQATDQDNGAGKRRSLADMSRTDALRFLDDARGREMLRSSVAADSKLGKSAPPEKDW